LRARLREKSERRRSLRKKISKIFLKRFSTQQRAIEESQRARDRAQKTAQFRGRQPRVMQKSLFFSMKMCGARGAQTRVRATTRALASRS
jgi:hypothetical protein